MWTFLKRLRVWYQLLAVMLFAPYVAYGSYLILQLILPNQGGESTKGFILLGLALGAIGVAIFNLCLLLVEAVRLLAKFEISAAEQTARSFFALSCLPYVFIAMFTIFNISAVL